MRIDSDPARILYAVGALFGIAAVLYFARDIVFDLSITVRAVLLLLVFVALLVGATSVSRPRFVLLLYLLAAATYLAFLAYALSGFEVGADGTFLALLVSAALFLSLGYLVYERDRRPSSRTARYLVVGVALLGVAFVGADLLASDVTYDVAVDDEAAVSASEGVEVGSVTVENRFVFREPIDLPRATACLYLPSLEDHEMRPRPVQYLVDGERLPDSIGGGETLVASMTVRTSDEEVAAAGETIPVEAADECPPEGDGPRILVRFGDDASRLVPV